LKINHYDLCRRTAERAIKTADIVLYEYNIMGETEQPDVLVFNNSYTKLYEIKVNYSDFKKDANKECRIEYSVKYWLGIGLYDDENKKLVFNDPRLTELLKEKPHIGIERSYVCPFGLIQPEEVGNWGLIWVKNNRFYIKKHSKKFKRNLYKENKILCHAMRKLKAGYDDNILVKEYAK